MAAYKLTVRRKGASERERFEHLEQALDALERRLDTLVVNERRASERVFAREYEPIAQVAVRGEIAGPRRLRGGVDVRGDGSAEAFTGRIVRRLVERQPGENAYDALRRALRA